MPAAHPAISCALCRHADADSALRHVIRGGHHQAVSSAARVRAIRDYRIDRIVQTVG